MSMAVVSERIVPAVGPRNARIAIVGEAPGAEEERRGVPFVGASGRLLNQMLSAAGIVRSQCFVTNVVKVRPPNNDFSVFYEKRHRPKPELLRWREELKRELAEVRPNVIIALGAEALRALTGDERASIGDWRGSIIATDVGKVVPTYHPAMVLRQYSWRPIVEFDLRRAREESQSPELKLPERTLRTKPTLGEALDFLNRANDCELITFDIETIKRGDPPRAVADCIAIAVSPSEAMCIPFCRASDGEPVWSWNEEAAIWRALAELMANPRVRKVAHHGQYDMLVLRRHGIRVVNYWLDTMNLMNVVYPEFPKGLDFCTSIFTRQPYYKHLIDVDRWLYNALDAAVTFEVAQALLKDAGELGVLELYFRHVHPLVQIYVEVQERGVRIDTQRLAEAKAQVEREIAELQAKLDELVGHPLNVMSPAQVQRHLYEELRLPKRFSKSGSVTSSEAALKALRARYDVPAIDLILALRERKKLLATYLNAPFDPDGRMRATYNVAGTETGRLSSSESIDGTGTNLQNIPHGVPRQIIVPDPGNVFVGADLSQAEARVVAWLSQDERMIEVFESGGDIHKRNASFIFNKSEGEVTADERYLAKRVVHACVTPEHEVLTPHGWVRIDQLTDGDIVAQWEDSGVIRFVQAKVLRYDYDGDLLVFRGRAFSLQATHEHRMPWYTSVGNLRVSHASALPAYARLPVCGIMNPDVVSASQDAVLAVRLAVAFQADGTLQGRKLVFHLKKERKIQRLIELVGSLAEVTRLSDGSTTVRIPLEAVPLLQHVVEFRRTPDGVVKRFKWDVLTMSLTLRDAFLDEVVRWDGWVLEGHRYEYVTTDLHNAVVVQTVAHVTGMEALLREGRTSTGRSCYEVSLNRRRYARAESLDRRVVRYTGYVYSLQVPSTFYLIRHDGRIMVTGNSNYGMGPRKFAQIAEISESQAKELLDRYFKTFPRIRGWHREVEQTIIRTRTLVNPFGRRRTFYDRIGPELFREAYAYIPQSTVADQLHRATLEIYARLPEGARIALQVHDSIVIECRADQAEEVMAIVKEALERPIVIKGRPLVIPAEVKVGSNWDEV